MTSHPAFRRFAFAYTTTFAVLYAVARAKGLVLFTFYPSLGLVMMGLHRSRDVVDPALEFLAPEMYWYGWTATAATGALMFACRRIVAGPMDTLVLAGVVWAAPVLAMIVCVYLTIPWFRE
jgi:hypothetical protein